MRSRLLVLDTPRLEGVAGDAALPAALAGWLLALLSLRGGWVSREELSALLWPEEEAGGAHHKLRVHLHRLRQRLVGWGVAPLLHAERHRLRLDLRSDVDDFRVALGRGDRATALSLCRRPFLDGWRLPSFPLLEDWADRERQHITTTWRAAAIRHAQDLAARQGHGEALELLQRLLADDPLAEDLLQSLMRCAIDGGYASVGLQHYAAYTRRLASELGTEPMPETTRLHLALRRTHAEAPVVVHQVQPPLVPAILRSGSALVGRELMLLWLQSPRPGAAQLSGPPGIGKSSLLRAALPGATWLACREGLDELPLHPFVEVLRAQRAVLIDRLPAQRIELARLVPAYAADTLPPADPQLGKTRLFEALALAMQALAAPLVIDDVQWADALTREWLAYALHRGGLQIALACRSGEGGAAWSALERGLASAGLIEIRSVPALDAAQMAELVAALAGTDERPVRFADWLARGTGGNPFFALEVLRGLFDAGRLRIEHGAWATDVDLVTRDYSELEIPPRAMAATRDRVSRLPPLAQKVLAAAAVVGNPMLAAQRLAEVCESDADTVIDTCALLEEAGFLNDQGFAHDLVRQSVYRGLAPQRRKRLHQRVAVCLEAAPAAEAVDAVVVAHHWRAAGEPQRALPAALRAANALRERGGLEESAVQFAEIAATAEDPTLRLLARTAVAEHLLLSDLDASRQMLEEVLATLGSVPTDGQQAALRVRVHAALADNAVYAGELARAAAHVTSLQPQLALINPAERAHALEIVVEVSMRRGDFASAHAALTQARRDAPASVTLDIYAAMLAWCEVRLPDAVAGFQRVLRDHPAHARYITVENDLGVALHAQGALVEAELSVRRGLSTWAGVPHAQCLSQLNLGAILLSAGRYPAALDALELALALARDQHARLFEGEALHRLAGLALACGWPELARTRSLAALKCLPADGDPLRLAQWHAQAVPAALACGDGVAAATHVRTAIGLAAPRRHAITDARVERATAQHALALGDAAGAATAAQRMVALAERRGLGELQVEGLLLLARSHECDGRTVQAAELAGQAVGLALQRRFDALAWRGHALTGRCGAGLAPSSSAEVARLQALLFAPFGPTPPDASMAAAIEPGAGAMPAA